MPFSRAVTGQGSRKRAVTGQGSRKPAFTGQGSRKRTVTGQGIRKHPGPQPSRFRLFTASRISIIQGNSFRKGTGYSVKAALQAPMMSPNASPAGCKSGLL
eukprot:351814-Chlamydomonas_euryale.AAC.1